MDINEQYEEIERGESSQKKGFIQLADGPQLNQEQQLEPRGFGDECAIEKASCFQRLLFTWVFPLWRIGKKYNKITIPMLGRLHEQDSSEVQIKKLEKYWNKYKSTTGRNKLCKAFLRAEFIRRSGTHHSALCHVNVMKFLQNPDDNDYMKASMIALCMVFSQLISFLISEHAYVYSDIQGYKSETALIGLISEKSMKISPSASKSFSQGEIINRLGTDTSNLKQFQQKVTRLTSIIATLLIGTLGFSQILGVAILSGLVPLILLLLFNMFLAKKLADFQKNMMEVQDERIEVTTEAMQNIKTLKLSIWVPHFQEKINKARDKGIKLLKKKNLIEIGQSVVFHLIPLTIIGTIMLVFIVSGQMLSPSIVYTLMLIFEIIKFQFMELPYIISSFVESYTSLKRIEDYLLAEEAQQYFISQKPADPFEYALQIQNACFSWKIQASDEKEDQNRDQ